MPDTCAVRLEMNVDPEPLRRELRSVQGDNWRHQRPYSAGIVGRPISVGWTCFPLRSPGGLMDRTDPGGPSRLAFADTPALAALPAFTRLLGSLPCPLRSARLLALDPGAQLEEHRDQFVGFEYGQLRLHVPIVTNPGAILHMEGRRHHWEPGEVWYANFTLPHSLSNQGRAPRVHLVVDCMVNEELLCLFPGWFQEKMRRLRLVMNRPRCAPAPLTEAPEFLLPAGMVSDLLADIDDVDLRHRPGVPASVEQEGGNVVLRTAAGATCALVPVGPHEYRFEGWTEERTLSFDALPHSVLLNDRRRFAPRTWVLSVLPGVMSGGRPAG